MAPRLRSLFRRIRRKPNKPTTEGEPPFATTNEAAAAVRCDAEDSSSASGDYSDDISSRSSSSSSDNSSSSSNSSSSESESGSSASRLSGEQSSDSVSHDDSSSSSESSMPEGYMDQDSDGGASGYSSWPTEEGSYSEWSNEYSDDDSSSSRDWVFEAETLEALELSANDYGEHGPPPASAEFIDELPRIQARPEDLLEPANQSCRICLEKWNADTSSKDTNSSEQILTRVPCTHLFHRDCLTGWLKQHCTCPVCRYEFTTDDAEYEVERKKRMANRKPPRCSLRQLEQLSTWQLRTLLEDPPLSMLDRDTVVECIVRDNAVSIVSEDDSDRTAKTRNSASPFTSPIRSNRRRRNRWSSGSSTSRSSQPPRLRLRRDCEDSSINNTDSESTTNRGATPVTPSSSDRESTNASVNTSDRRAAVPPAMPIRIPSEPDGMYFPTEDPALNDSPSVVVDRLAVFLQDGNEVLSEDSRMEDMLLSVAANYTEMGCYHVSQGSLETALQHHEKALLLFETLHGKMYPRTADALDLVGSVYYDEGDYEAAEDFHRDAMSVRQQIFGDNHVQTALSYYIVGWVALQLGYFDEALEYQERALAIREVAYGRNHVATASSYCAVGFFLMIDKKDSSVVMKYFQQSYKIRLSTLGEEHPDTISTLSLIAVVHYDEDRFGESLTVFRKVLQLRQRTLAACNPLIATAHANVAAALAKSKKVAESIDHLERALSIFEKDVATSLVDISNVRLQLGRLYRDTSNSKRAQELLRQSFADRQLLYKKGLIWYEDMMFSSIELGLLLTDLGELQEAFEILDYTKRNRIKNEEKGNTTLRRPHRRADVVLEDIFSAKVVGTTLPCALTSDGSSVAERSGRAESQTSSQHHGSCSGVGHISLGQIADAESGTDGATSTALSLVIEGFTDSGIFYMETNDLSSALAQFKAALRVCQLCRGDEHPETTGVLDCIGGVYSKLERYDEALETHQLALDIRTQILGPNHPHTATSFVFIGWVLFAKDQYMESLENHKRALDIRQQYLGVYHEQTAASFETVGSILQMLGDNNSSLEHHLVALKIREKILGADHLDTARSHSQIGSVQHERGLLSEAVQNHERALQIRMKVLGAEDPEVSESSDTITSLHSLSSEAEKVLEASQQALLDCKKKHGKRHKLTASLMNNIGLLHHQLGNYDMAVKYLKESLKTKRKLQPETDSVDTAASIAGTQQNLQLLRRDRRHLTTPIPNTSE